MSELENLLKEYQLEPTSEQSVSEDKMSILIVDDEARIGESLGNIFKEEYRVIHVSSGKDALSTVNKNINCIIMDAKMPGMDGFETTNLIKEDFPHIPVIMHTAYHSEHKTADVVDCKFFGYIEKGSADVRDLRFKVRQACERYRLILENEEYKNELERKVEQLERAYDEVQKQRDNSKRLERIMTGGFAHEVRNALTGGFFELSTLLENEEEPSATAVVKGEITKIFEYLLILEKKQLVPKNELDDIAQKSFAPISIQLKKLAHVLPAVHNDLARGLSLAKQILEYSKIQEIKRGRERVNAVKLIKEILKQLNRKNPAITQMLDNGIPATDAFITGEKSQLSSIFTNIMLNAYDAMESCSVKKIYTKISLTTEDNCKYLVVTIEDTGTGIEKDHLENLFHPFFTKKYSKGTGLGLAVSKRIAELYGGNIEVKSEVGAGTEFNISLLMSDC